MSNKQTLRSENFAPTLQALLEHKEWLRRLARGLVFDASQADDVVQQVFLSALKYRPSTDRDMRPWLKVVATAVAKKIGRSEVRRTRREKKSAREEVLPVEETIARLETGDTYRQLGEFLKNLEEPYRAILIAHYFEGIPLDEIGKRMGYSRSTVRNRFKRGIELLRARLDSRYGDRTAWGMLLLPVVSLEAPAVDPASTIGLAKSGSKKALWGAAAAIFLATSGLLLTAGVIAQNESPSTLSSDPASREGFADAREMEPGVRSPLYALPADVSPSPQDNGESAQSGNVESSPSPENSAQAVGRKGAVDIKTGKAGQAHPVSQEQQEQSLSADSDPSETSTPPPDQAAKPIAPNGPRKTSKGGKIQRVH